MGEAEAGDGHEQCWRDPTDPDVTFHLLVRSHPNVNNAHSITLWCKNKSHPELWRELGPAFGRNLKRESFYRFKHELWRGKKNIYVRSHRCGTLH